MKALFLAWIAVASLPSVLRAADVSPFKNFEGDFSKKAHVKVVGGQTGKTTGRIRQAFRIGKSGEEARLLITGTLKLAGATRKFRAVYLFRRPNAEGERRVALTNLAPGVDDGYSADQGTYQVLPRIIRAEVPFVFGTVTGNAQLVIRQKKLPRGSRLLITQTLVTDALPRPIVWRFKGLQSR